MKSLQEISAIVIDYGSFPCLADMLGRHMAKCCYYTPYETEYREIARCCLGDGFHRFQRVDDFMSPDVFDSIDLWVFPDIGFGGLQRYLRKQGKLVWGSMGASDLELYRTRFLNVVQGAGLPVVKSVKLRGLSKLAEHLKGCEDQWVKINRYRADMETWHHLDYEHSKRELERLSMQFGPMREHVVFVVQESINGTEEEPVLEVGFDGWSVDGEFPAECYQGYEAKNELYLGSLLKYGDMPDAVRAVNQAMAPALREFGYRNFWATEIRVKGDDFYFIDPTARMAGQTMEHLMETCENLAEVIYEGAQGNLIEAEFAAPFAAEATLHHKVQNACAGWKTLRVPKEIERWVKPYRCCMIDGAYQFPPLMNDELGVVCGLGDSIEEAIQSLKNNFEPLEKEPVEIHPAGFADLLKQIQDAEEAGVMFSDQPVPDPQDVLT